MLAKETERADDKALMEMHQHQQLLETGHDPELRRQAKSALLFTSIFTFCLLIPVQRPRGEFEHLLPDRNPPVAIRERTSPALHQLFYASTNNACCTAGAVK